MEDRIKINGEWYIRENASKKVDKDIISYSAIEITNHKKWKVEATVLGVDNQEKSMPSIELYQYTDGDFTVVEYMDNESWIYNVAIRDKEALNELRDQDEDIKEAIITLCDKMKELGWVKKG